MLNLSERVAPMGTVVTRGLEAREHLRRIGAECGYFIQNDVQIVVYRDSTERELHWQYIAKCAERCGTAGVR